MKMHKLPSLSSRNALADVIKKIKEDAEGKAERMHGELFNSRALRGKERAPIVLLHGHCGQSAFPCSPS